MKYEYTDEKEPTFQLLEPGEYVLEVTKAEFGISNGANTKGCHNCKITLSEEQSGVEIRHTLTFPDSSTPEKSAQFLRAQIDSFVRASGMASEKGQKVEMTPESIVEKRLWAEVVQEPFTSREGKELKSNKIKRFIANKPLPDRPF